MKKVYITTEKRSSWKARSGIVLLTSLLAAILARIVYSGWYSPLFVFTMRGDGIRGIFSGIDGFFLPGPLRAFTLPILNHPYVSVTFYYSIFHPLCMTKYLGVVLIAVSFLSAISIIWLSMRIFNLPEQKQRIFALLMIIVIFNWAPFYDGVLQGYPPEFVEVLGIIIGFFLFLRRKPVLAGVVFGLVSTIKILPVIFLIYFAYKKQYRLLISGVVTCFVLSAIILWKENINPNLINAIIISTKQNAAYGHNSRDAGLNAFIHFVFHRSLNPNMLMAVHYTACLLLALLFASVERAIDSVRDKYLFGLAAVSLGIFQISPHMSEMYWYILLLPALIFNIWMLVKYRDRLFCASFLLSYIFMYGFSALSVIFKFAGYFGINRALDPAMYLQFNMHGGAFIGVWLLFFTTYGLTLKYLVIENATR